MVFRLTESHLSHPANVNIEKAIKKSASDLEWKFLFIVPLSFGPVSQEGRITGNSFAGKKTMTARNPMRAVVGFPIDYCFFT